MRLIIKPETETRTHQQHRKLAVWRCVEQRGLLETFIIGENAPLQCRSSRTCVCVCVCVRMLDKRAVLGWTFTLFTQQRRALAQRACKSHQPPESVCTGTSQPLIVSGDTWVRRTQSPPLRMETRCICVCVCRAPLHPHSARVSVQRGCNMVPVFKL